MMHRKNRDIVIMAVGPQYSGKSTLFNNIVQRPIITDKTTSEIDVYVIGGEYEQNNRKIIYIETPGLGALLNEDTVHESIINYIKEQYDSYIEEESKINRDPYYEDTRVQCLLYTIPATGFGLRERDVDFLKKASGLVNIIPVITKADALTVQELKSMKELIREQLVSNEIQIFKLVAEDDEELLPFAVICADDLSGVDRFREHVAGIIQIESKDASDLITLRNALLRKYSEALMETTSIDLYEKYRREVLESSLNQ